MESLLQMVVATDTNLQFVANKMVDGIPAFIPTDNGYLLCGHYSKSSSVLKTYLATYSVNRRETDIDPLIISMGSHDGLPLLLAGETWNPQQNPAHQPLYSIVGELPAPIIIEYKNRRLTSPTYKIIQKLLEFLYSPLWGFECVGLMSSDDIQRIYGQIPAYCIREVEEYNPTIRGRDMTILRVEEDGKITLKRHGAMKIVDMPYSIQGQLMSDIDEQEKTNRLLKMGIIFKEKNTMEQFMNNQFGRDDIYMRGIFLDPLARQRERMELRGKYMGYVTLSNSNSIDDAETHFYEVLWKCMRVRGMACIIVNLGDLPNSGECLLRNMIIRYCDIIM